MMLVSWHSAVVAFLLALCVGVVDGGKGKGKDKKKTRGDDTLGGFGDCDCDGGIRLLRFVYVNHQQPKADSIQVFYEGLDDTLLCSFDRVVVGQEMECSIVGKGFDEFENETFIRVTYDSSSPSTSTCEGSWHTSCSHDLVGVTAKECTDVVISGWQDTHTDKNDCDDGFEPCEVRVTTEDNEVKTINTYCSNVGGTADRENPYYSSIVIDGGGDNPRGNGNRYRRGVRGLKSSLFNFAAPRTTRRSNNYL